MQKMLILMLVLIGSLGLAQSSNRSAFGIYLIGGQYSLDLGAAEVRLGVGFPLLLGGAGLVSGSLDVRQFGVRQQAEKASPNVRRASWAGGNRR